MENALDALRAQLVNAPLDLLWEACSSSPPYVSGGATLLFSFCKYGSLNKKG